MSKDFKVLIAALVGTVATYFLNVTLNINPMAASGLVGLVSFFLLPKDLALVTYTASFAGMSSSAILTNYLMAILAGLLVGIIFMLVQAVFNGYGGKLGTIAALSVLITLGIFKLF
ncbi:conserved membrane hypothetical protein [[Clostridium] ultunense Esp]|uniref:Uncharacterized protein n=1 Tax=[Clostridium] ultunense Esp TaxID=1288971 RepID=M1ZCK5_9FIRM|nr:hypothetical protein [Schnuerera ultunensis]CCQ96216.1 conserved membrane hypothetical protein [[Clostridium] ultunense Esp]SHD78177.1 conserved membrane protein of unknown function [[Clostridium] ultunense Esp]